ncbi:PREDICTED: transmembrane and ubiquitin-like domain-containing protein 1 [Thamnophis sirtalis]|uniref:Transmembrane and ubiquitin-like domain-containing protein 1 n=1 Tax=Thamnophis sirtalis TaxID=35019 RepID=A0A6I9YKA1_9SAUR|nr:PREDICTED: transmembrane and ubiquitin-like domain-containing protein 1 [Thamnophis sirtalis]
MWLLSHPPAPKTRHFYAHINWQEPPPLASWAHSKRTLPPAHRSSPSSPTRLYFPGQEQLVRLIYQGQLLRDDAQTLAALHLTNNSVLHCHVAQHRPPPAGPNAGLRTDAEAAHAALNVGSLMMPLLVLMLAALWYFQLQHRHVFTATATTCLAGLTLVFSFVAFAVYRR